MRGKVARVRACVVALVMASVVTVGLAALAGGGAYSAGAAEACSEPLVVGVRGSGEPAGFGDTVVKTVDVFNSVYGSATDSVALDYPAAGIGAVWAIKPWRAGEFDASVKDGIGELKARNSDAFKTCPDQKIVLFGYSQGALIINRVLVSFAKNQPLINRVAAVGLIADPARLGASNFTHSGQGLASRKLNGIAIASTTAKKQDLPAALNGRARSVCLDGDLVCAFRPGKAVIDPGAMHAVYKSSLAASVGSWAADKVGVSSQTKAPTPTTSPTAVTANAVLVCSPAPQATEASSVITYSLYDPTTWKITKQATFNFGRSSGLCDASTLSADMTRVAWIQDGKTPGYIDPTGTLHTVASQKDDFAAASLGLLDQGFKPGTNDLYWISSVAGSPDVIATHAPDGTTTQTTVPNVYTVGSYPGPDAPCHINWDADRNILLRCGNGDYAVTVSLSGASAQSFAWYGSDPGFSVLPDSTRSFQGIVENGNGTMVVAESTDQLWASALSPMNPQQVATVPPNASLGGWFSTP